jgi:hypothetical protein
MNNRQPSISTEIFSSYLKARRWTPVSIWRGMVVWERDEPDADQVLVPAEGDYRTVERLLRRAMVDLAEAEDRPLDQLVTDLEAPEADTQRFRLFPSTPSGTIPFNDGRRAVDAIFHVLRDSGWNIEEGHKILYQDRAPESVYRFLDRVQLGLSEPGSYVFTTRTPGRSAVVESSESALFDFDDLTDDPQLSDHEVVVRLHEAVSMARSVAGALVENRSLGDPTEVGLSANFCKALAELGGPHHDREIEIGFEWGFGHRTALPATSVRFTDRMTAKIHELGARLEELAKTGAAAVEGRIIGLAREEAGQRYRVQVKGRVIAGQGEYDGTLWVFVTESDYDRAIEAHRGGDVVRAEGELQMERGGLRLYLRLNRLEVLES